MFEGEKISEMFRSGPNCRITRILLCEDLQFSKLRRNFRFRKEKLLCELFLRIKEMESLTFYRFNHTGSFRTITKLPLKERPFAANCSCKVANKGKRRPCMGLPL